MDPAAEPVLEVADISTLELLGTVPASRLSEVHAGTEFSFQTTAVPDTTFQARVINVSPAVDPATDNGTVRIRIKNSKHLLKLGMFLSVELPLKQIPTGLIVAPGRRSIRTKPANRTSTNLPATTPNLFPFSLAFKQKTRCRSSRA